MKHLARKILMFDKTLLVLLFVILLSIIFIIMSAFYANTYEGSNRQLKTQLGEIVSLSADVTQIKAMVESKEKKIGLKQSAAVVSTLESILKTLGLEAQVIKPTGKAKVGEYNEENAELELQGTDLNSIVNLLFKIDLSPAPLKIRSVSIRSSFENPDKFIFNLSVSLMSRA